MIKNLITRKFLLSLAALFALFLLYLIPKNEDINFQDKLPQKLKYIDTEISLSTIYLLDNHNFLAQTSVVNDNKDIEGKAKELLEILIKGGIGEGKVPNGFQSLLPSDTKILSLKYEENLIKVNFSKELLDIKEEFEEKMIEAIVYTLTSIDEVKNIIIYVDGDILTKLPKTNINLPSVLNRNFGINKEYDIDSFKGVNQIVIYYISSYNDNTYYIPVTKYVNDNREKIEIIIDELSSTNVYHSNLRSYLNNSAKLLSVEKSNELMELEFNSLIYNNEFKKNILEEVIYTICLSIKENYNVEKVVFNVETEKVYEHTLN